MKVEVLMSAYNGERFIMEQLDSIYAQKGVDVSVLVRDDGSTDGTHRLLDAEQQTGRLRWYAGENLKPAHSFMDLMLHASPDADLYAFSDQDDVWMEDKLVAAAHSIGDEEGPALYFCPTRLVDEHLRPLKQVVVHPRLTYGEALILQFVSGCTMVINKPLLSLVNKYSPAYLRMHDYWIYSLTLAIGGKVIYDDEPHINYRQHSHNAVGMSSSWIKQWKERIGRVKANEHIRQQTAQQLLIGYGEQMSVQNRQLTQNIVDYRHSLKAKCRLLFSRQLYANSPVINLTSRLALLFNRF